MQRGGARRPDAREPRSASCTRGKIAGNLRTPEKRETQSEVAVGVQPLSRRRAGIFPSEQRAQQPVDPLPHATSALDSPQDEGQHRTGRAGPRRRRPERSHVAAHLGAHHSQLASARARDALPVRLPSRSKVSMRAYTEPAQRIARTRVAVGAVPVPLAPRHEPRRPPPRAARAPTVGVPGVQPGPDAATARERDVRAVGAADAPERSAAPGGRAGELAARAGGEGE